MKLSTKGRYGLRLMIELALHEKNELVTLKEISKQQEISQKYLWSLITPLQKAGLVRAERGARVATCLPGQRRRSRYGI